MDASLRSFISEFTGAVVSALVVVIIVAFLSIPFTLGGHPGEVRPVDRPVPAHLS